MLRRPTAAARALAFFLSASTWRLPISYLVGRRDLRLSCHIMSLEAANQVVVSLTHLLYTHAVDMLRRSGWSVAPLAYTERATRCCSAFVCSSVRYMKPVACLIFSAPSGERTHFSGDASSKPRVAKPLSARCSCATRWRGSSPCLFG